MLSSGFLFCYPVQLPVYWQFGTNVYFKTCKLKRYGWSAWSTRLAQQITVNLN